MQVGIGRLPLCCVAGACFSSDSGARAADSTGGTTPTKSILDGFTEPDCIVAQLTTVSRNGLSEALKFGRSSGILCLGLGRHSRFALELSHQTRRGGPPIALIPKLQVLSNEAVLAPVASPKENSWRPPLHFSARQIRSSSPEHLDFRSRISDHCFAPARRSLLLSKMGWQFWGCGRALPWPAHSI